LRDFDDGLTRYVSTWKRVPRFARIILIAQFVVIIFLATWIGQEYQNNQYLQAYVSSSIQTSLPALLTTLPVFLGVGAIGVYAKLLKGGMEDEDENSLPEDKATLGTSTPVLYPDEYTLSPVEEPLLQLEETPAPRSTRTVKTKGNRSREPIRRSRKRTPNRPVSNPAREY
jgi:hypothetical protein